jgi:hypothetical protein
MAPTVFQIFTSYSSSWYILNYTPRWNSFYENTYNVKSLLQLYNSSESRQYQ